MNYWKKLTSYTSEMENHIYIYKHIMHQNLEHKGAEAAARAINNSKIGLLYNKSRVDWL